MGGIFFFIGIIAIVVIAIIVSFQQAKKRREALKTIAQSLNLTFSEKGTDSFLEPLAKFHLFSQGHSKKIINILKGTATDRDFSIFDYQYTTGGGRNSHTWNQTVILLRSDKLHLPCFVLRPENLFHKIGGVFGYKDIDFDRFQTFSKKYLLRGDDEQAVRRIFTDDVLMYYDQNKGLSTEASGDELIFYRVSKRVHPEQIRSFMEEGFQMFNFFKNKR